MPAASFTAKWIQAVKAPAKGRVDYIDNGLTLRVSESGHKSWGVFYRFNHRFRRMTLGSYPNLSLKEARAMADDVLHAAANRKDPKDLGAEKKADRAAGTFGALVSRFLSDREGKKSVKEYRRILEKYFSDWNGLKAHTITAKDVIERFDREEKRGGAHARKAFAVVHAMFNFGLSKQLVTVNPCHGLSRPGEAKERDRVLSVGEMHKVWGAILNEQDLMQAQFKLRFYTAQRGGEVLTMAWPEIDFDGAVWNIPAEKAKNGHAHRVPLSGQALAILTELKRTAADSHWVFPSRYKADEAMTHVQKAIQRVRKRARVAFTGHDIRRTAASHMASLGVHRFTIRKLLNHKDQEVTAIYDRYSYDKEKREALQLWANYLDEVVSKSEPKRVIPMTRAAVAESRIS